MPPLPGRVPVARRLSVSPLSTPCRVRAAAAVSVAVARLCAPHDDGVSTSRPHPRRSQAGGQALAAGASRLRQSIRRIVLTEDACVRGRPTTTLRERCRKFAECRGIDTLAKFGLSDNTDSAGLEVTVGGSARPTRRGGLSERLRRRRDRARRRVRARGRNRHQRGFRPSASARGCARWSARAFSDQAVEMVASGASPCSIRSSSSCTSARCSRRSSSRRR